MGCSREQWTTAENRVLQGAGIYAAACVVPKARGISGPPLSRNKYFLQIDGDTFLNSDIKEGKILLVPWGHPY
jgi:hypothetical protein